MLVPMHMLSMIVLFHKNHYKQKDGNKEFCTHNYHRVGIIEPVDSICRDSADTQYMLIQTNFSKSPKQVTYYYYYYYELYSQC